MKIAEDTIKELIRARAKTREDLSVIKRKIAKKHKSTLPDNISLLKIYHELLKNKRIKPSETIRGLLVTRPVRSLSGIVNVSVLTKPYPCPGKCIFCPTQKGVPKSYLSSEPAVMRAILNKYDPYKQVKMRLGALKNAGHPTDKVDLRTVGGTWSFYKEKYQIWFVKRCFDACNEKTSKNLKTAQRLNEKAKHRITGISIETRPDFIDKKEIKRLRELGITRVELGVESIYQDVLLKNKRGHGVESIIQATRLLKDAGFKICYQMMPNLFGSNLEKDEKMFKTLFSDSDFQPDLLKIYPCAILKGTFLHRLWKKKKYRPYTEKQLMGLIRRIKENIPRYVRIQRITRDIPSRDIISGPAKISNLRQLLSFDSKKRGWKCKCIRCREVGKNYNPKEKLKMFRENYAASGGKEIFLTFEDRKRERLYSLLRLRISSDGQAIIREVHTYGQLSPLAGKSGKSPQHKGLGKKLIKEAEKIAEKEFKKDEISVISGIGVKNYYKKLGYKIKNTYMAKRL